MLSPSWLPICSLCQAQRDAAALQQYMTRKLSLAATAVSLAPASTDCTGVV